MQNLDEIGEVISLYLFQCNRRTFLNAHIFWFRVRAQDVRITINQGQEKQCSIKPEQLLL